MIMARWCVSVYDHGRVVCYCLCSWQGDVFMIMARWYVSVGSWYHGRLGRAGAEDLLRDQEAGSYLVRESESKLGSFVLSYLGQNYKITHFRCVYICVVCVHHLHVYGVCSACIVQTFCHWHCTNLQWNSLVPHSFKIKVCLCVQNESNSHSVIIFTC